MEVDMKLIVELSLAVLVVVSIVVKLTKTKKDDAWLLKVKKVLKDLGLLKGE